jgi:metallo-beta-lactamase class B
MAALFGGSILTPGRISDDGLTQYIRSVAHFAEATRKMNVDVEVQNHPLYDGFESKLSRLKARRNGQPHPFVVGRQGYQHFMTVMSECSQAEAERRKQSGYRDPGSGIRQALPFLLREIVVLLRAAQLSLR